jgi:predicted transcriptional regulator
VHLRRLEAVGLISSALEFSEDGKAMKFYEVNPFVLELTPQLLAQAAHTLTAGADGAGAGPAAGGLS